MYEFSPLVQFLQNQIEYEILKHKRRGSKLCVIEMIFPKSAIWNENLIKQVHFSMNNKLYISKFFINYTEKNMEVMWKIESGDHEYSSNVNKRKIV